MVSPSGASDPSPLPPLHPTMLLPNPRGLDSHSLATAMALHPAGNAAGPVAAADPTGSPRQVRGIEALLTINRTCPIPTHLGKGGM